MSTTLRPRCVVSAVPTTTGTSRLAVALPRRRAASSSPLLASQAERRRRSAARGAGAEPAAAAGPSGRETARPGRTGPVVVVDNYDSFTYNLVQASNGEGRSEMRAGDGEERGDRPVASAVLRGDDIAQPPPPLDSLLPEPFSRPTLSLPPDHLPQPSALLSRPHLSRRQYLGSLGLVGADRIRVIKNDELTAADVVALNPKGVLVSPGPGAPEDSGISLEICDLAGKAGIPVFGVCMGHQCIGQTFGGKVVRAPTGLMHGKTSLVWHTGEGLLAGIPSPFEVCRYHSLVVSDAEGEWPEDLVKTAWIDDGTVMALRHRDLVHVQGVQFHPESIMTDHGMKIVANWVAMCDED